VQPKTFAETRFAYKPPYVGSAKIIAKFTSKEMDDVDGYRVFEISPRPEDVINDNGANNTMIMISKENIVE
jgi:transglutaminase 1